ncbi:6-phosphogluconolactonase [Rhodovulum iodosum]|uniref:6-phosphogluconolactonase n=1 Tax=Rhodovulum iodosum TaxID=68291 RepID=A0ABV3XV52_9RHOB|nr:6-phosphogluconolactonase [Rhodovulum robiginosum]RSK33605.1 6-phosphogluconolactonase [Rhodovulum robiginosum]
MKLITYADRDMMAIDLANVLAGELKAALFHADWASFAVPGGSTPGPVFDDLCAATLDWDRVRVIPTDERLVPPDHDRSNERLIRERLLVGAAAEAQFVGLRPGADGMEGLCSRVSRYLPLSVLVLGMGDDMHTASLFPGAQGLEAALEPDAPPVIRIETPGAPEPRISLTAPVLRGAMSTHLVITGQEKRAALERAVELNDPRLAPVSAILKNATIHWAE